MKVQLILDENPITYAVIFDADEEVIGGLNRLAKTRSLSASQITGIGSFQEAVLGFYDRRQKEYQKIRIAEQVEVLSLIGDISSYEGEPKIHAHVVLGKSDGTACGGHLLEARVWPTLELIVTENPHHLRRRYNPEAGLPLIEIEPVGV
jgi:predicted DNA-binding protein with PD1-like motif